ncbi:CHAT domain-containing protein, partial [Thiotrichales bacterium HSG1]|nr:CHAT domain-containing protein [Thiotrichales bacterium HSG1]
LLTYDNKMTMDKLQNIIGLGRFRDKPLEMLTLSACKTAVGDDKAALGLAGVAIKAGARSAIATLWFVDDEGTSLAISDFYEELLNNSGLSKAKALQNAQKKTDSSRSLLASGLLGSIFIDW